MKRVVEGKVPIFIDEAYLELAAGKGTESMVSLLSQKKNDRLGLRGIKLFHL